MEDIQYLYSSKDEANVQSFHFKKRREGINWRLLASINVERIIRENDIKGLQEILENLTFCDIEKEDFRNLDPNYIKLFQLAQLAVEYLLYTQETLLQSKQSIDEQGKVKRQSAEEINSKCAKLEDQLHQAQKENRQLKKTIYAFQLWSKIPGGLGMHQGGAGAPGAGLVAATYSRCKFCGKVFSGEYYLEAHLDRRHGDRPNYVRELTENQHPQVINIPQNDGGLNADLLDKITNTIEKFSSKVLDTERSLRLDLERKMTEALQSKESAMSELFKQDRMGHEREMQELKTMMTRQLEEERRLLREERLALDQLYAAQSRRSNIGALEDDDDSKRETDLLMRLEKRYDEAFARMTGALEQNLQLLKPVQQPSGENDERIHRLEQEKLLLNENLNMTNAKLRQLEDLMNGMQSNRKIPSKTNLSSIILDKWPVFVDIMSKFKSTPYVKNTLIKSKYSHQGVLLTGKRKEVEVMLESEVQKRGIAPHNMKEAHKITKALADEREARDLSDPYLPKMRDYVNDELDKIAKFKFKLKPSNLIISNSNTIGFLPHRSDILGSNTQLGSSAQISEDGRYTSMSRRSVKSDASSIKWDNDDESIDSNDSLTDDISEITQLSNSPTKPSFDPKKSFGKAFSALKATNAFKPSQSQSAKADPSTQKQPTQRKESLDPILKTAIGRVHDNKSRKDPLERRKESIVAQMASAGSNNNIAEEYQTSDISESLESLEKEVNKVTSRGPRTSSGIEKSAIISSLDDLKLSDDDLDTEHL